MSTLRERAREAAEKIHTGHLSGPFAVQREAEECADAACDVYEADPPLEEWHEAVDVIISAIEERRHNADPITSAGKVAMERLHQAGFIVRKIR